MWWSAMPGPDAPLGLGEARAIHIVGVGGAGMSAIASVLAAMGHVVTGSDLKASPVTERLVAQGIPVAIGHAAANVAGADLVTASPAVAPDNVELDAARRRGIVVVRRAEMLAAITATRRTVAVAGTHGKTTTSSMLALILVEAGLAPSFLIGADVGQIGANAVWDSGDLLVVEADESYGTFEVLEPALAVVTNIEADHLDHYGTFETLEAAFEALVARAPLGSGVGPAAPRAARVGARHGAISVGVDSSATYVMEDVELGRSAVAFDLVGPGGRLGRLSVPVPGLHNARNAAVAAVAALQVGAPFEAAAAALARFAGVPRRFEFRGERNGVTFVDDYAHLPSEVRAALAAASAGDWRRVVAVFQPHRYTRTAALADTFAGAFTDADVVVVTDVYSAGEPPVPGVSGALVVEAVRAQSPGARVLYAPTRSDLVAVVAGELRDGDLCLTLGAGDLTELPDELLGLAALGEPGEQRP